MTSPFSAVYLGQVGRDAQLGSPVRMNASSASDILSDSARGLAPPPVWVIITSVLCSQKQMSRQWKARMRPSKSGGCQPNHAM